MYMPHTTMIVHTETKEIQLMRMSKIEVSYFKSNLIKIRRKYKNIGEVWPFIMITYCLRV